MIFLVAAAVAVGFGLSYASLTGRLSDGQQSLLLLITAGMLGGLAYVNYRRSKRQRGP
jgi:hypothetical protein